MDSTLTIWEGRNTALHGKSHETELIVHAQLNADFRRIYKLKDAFADSAKQYFHLPLKRLLLRPYRNCQWWLHLAQLVAARASGRCGTGQQMLSTYYSYTFSSHQACTTSPPTLATPIHLQQLQLRSFYLVPKHLPMIPEELPQVADICRLSLPSVWHYLSNYNSAPMWPAALNVCVPSQ